jgi:hypothetical protein
MFIKLKKSFFKNSFFIFLPALAIALASLVFSAGFVSAAAFVESTKAGHNFEGWAWSETFGWVSFNSVHTTTPSPGSLAGNYGVNLRYSDGRVSGYAWSEHVGWINFNNTPPNHVRYDRISGEFIGSANVVVLGAQGELRLRNVTPTFGVSALTIDQTSADYGKLTGWAWNGNGTVPATNGIGVGWLSFNNASGGGSPYHVYVNMNHAPLIDNHQMWRTNPGPSEQVMPSGPAVISVGDTAEFRATWLNADNTNWAAADQGDRVRMFVCKANNNLTGTFSGENNVATGLDTANCDGGTWCRSEQITTEGAISCSKEMETTDMVGSGKYYYTTICDEFGYCSSPRFESDPFLLNDRPAAGSITSFGPPNYGLPGNPPTTGPGSLPLVTTPPLTSQDPYGNQDDHTMTFRSGWSDLHTNGRMTMHVCDSNSFNYSHDASQGCMGRTWCSAPNAVVPVGGPSGTLECVGNLDGSEPAGANTYYVYMCDGHGACTATPASAQFFINIRPGVADGMSAPNWDASDAATNPADESDLRAILEWNINDPDTSPGGMSDAYLQVNSLSGALDEEGLYSDSDLGVSVCDVAGCNVLLTDRGVTPVTDILAWNTAFQWTARVRDAYAWSEPRVYNHGAGGGGILTDDAPGVHYGDYGLTTNADNNSIGNNFTFTTLRHNFPIVRDDSVSYFPVRPSANEEVRATPNSFCYEDGVPDQLTSGAGIVNAARACTFGPGDCTFDWETDSDVAEIKISTNPLAWGTYLAGSDDQVIMRFKQEGASSNYTLTVHDRDGYFNTSAGAIIEYVNERLPSWQEVK